MRFEDKWDQVDETCSCCGQVTRRVKGITRQNLKRLIKPKFDLNELIFTLIIILVLLLAFAYKNETKSSREWISSMSSNCEANCLLYCGLNRPNPTLNLSMNVSNEFIPHS